MMWPWCCWCAVFFPAYFPKWCCGGKCHPQKQEQFDELALDLLEMEAMGFVVKDADGRYHAGPRERESR